MFDIESVIAADEKASEILANIKTKRYDNFDQFALVSEINDLDVAKSLIKKLLDERNAYLSFGYLKRDTSNIQDECLSCSRFFNCSCIGKNKGDEHDEKCAAYLR